MACAPPLEPSNEVQLAKGAIRAGIEILLRHAGISNGEVDQVIVAGAFGTYLTAKSAVSVSVFPNLPQRRFRQVGNAAGIARQTNAGFSRTKTRGGCTCPTDRVC